MSTPNPRSDASHRKFFRRLGADWSRKVVLEMRHLPDAMDDPAFAHHALEVASAAFRSAFGDGSLECFGCRQRWTAGRPVTVIGRFTFVGIRDAALVFGICPECVWSRDPIGTVTAAFQRDFGTGVASVEHMTVPGGHA